MGLIAWVPGGSALVKNLPAIQDTRVQSLGWKDPLKEDMQPTPVFLPGDSQGQRSLAGYRHWGLPRLRQD